MERFSRIESIGNIRLMQDIRPKQEKRDVTFAELLGKEMRDERFVGSRDGHSDSVLHSK